MGNNRIIERETDMKTFTKQFNRNMKQYTKYICALLLLAGMSAHAWGDCTLYGGVGGNTVIGSISSTDILPSTAPDVDGWSFLGAWCTNRYSASSPTTTYPSGSYIKWNGSTPGEETALYAVYASVCTEGTTVYTGAPFNWYYIDLSPRSGDSYAYVESENYCFSKPGETITIIAVPEAGKTVTSCSVIDEESNEVTVTPVDGTTFTFVMPSSEVSVEVSFECPSLTKPVMNEANSITSTGATLSWGTVTNAVKYKLTVYDDELNANDFSNITGTSKVVTGLDPNTHYNAYVYAYNSCDEYSEASLDIEFTTLQRYAISYNNNGGSGSKDSEYKDHGVSFTLPSTAGDMTKDGYHINGWLLGSSSGTPYDLGGSYTTNEAATFYAEWAPNDYAVSFNANGGSGSMDDVDKATGETCDLPACTFTAPSGKVFKCWAEGSAGGTERTVGYTHTVTGNITFYAVWRDASYSNYVFSCAELTLTAKLVTASTPIFITSTASKTVRSQDSILIVGSGLTPSRTLEFPDLPSKFAIKSRTNSALAVAGDGTINAVAYIYYTPDAEDTSDGLDKLTGITVSVGGAKPITKNLTQEIIGRHLPEKFVIAAKRNNKWYALPDTMTTTRTPKPIEIAVNDINNPSLAYTTADTKYSLAGPAASNISGGVGQYVKLVMNSLWSDDSDHSKGHAPLFGSATGTKTIGKSGTAQATNPLSKGWWWQLIQKNAEITNPQDAKYQIYCVNNDTTLSLKENAGNPIWGLYKSGIDELRLIPASDIVPTEAYFVEWAQHGGVIEVDATAETGVDATSVVAHLGEATSSAITLVQTKASDAKNKSSKYNYTVNLGGSIDFAANEGQMLTLEWKNGETVKAVSNIVVPKIVASNITINKTNYPLKSDWNTEVHVLPGKTVTVDADYSPNPDVTIKELNIYPGATVVASTGTLIATNLVLRNGWTRAREKTYDVARLYVTPFTATLKATNVYADWYIDYDQYYPVAVPWNATVANFTYRYCSVSPTVGPTANIRLRYYDGASRATNVQEGVGAGANWKEYGAAGNLAVPTTLTPSSGYIMTAKRPSGKAFSIIRMPLTLPSGTWGDGTWTTNGEQGTIGEAPSDEHKDQIAVTAHNTGSTPIYAQGWNLIANPYMANYQGTIEYADETKVQYVNIPDVDFKEYNQLPTATTKLAPASAFLIQAPKTGTITFGTAKRVPSAPSYRKEEAPESVPEQQAYIVLNNEQTEDMMGILVSDQYTAEYEINADLEKLLGDGTSLRTYMRYGDRNMAYLAINKVLAQEWIPVSVRLPQTGEFTFSLHEASIAGELEGVYLIDYTNNEVTNLIEDSYTFVAEAGTIHNRFAINATVGERQTPTAIDVVGADKNGDEPIKFLYHDKVFIWHHGVIYDATGKKVREINK